MRTSSVPSRTDLPWLIRFWWKEHCQETGEIVRPGPATLQTARSPGAVDSPSRDGLFLFMCAQLGGSVPRINGEPKMNIGFRGCQKVLSMLMIALCEWMARICGPHGRGSLGDPLRVSGETGPRSRMNLSEYAEEMSCGHPPAEGPDWIVADPDARLAISSDRPAYANGNHRLGTDRVRTYLRNVDRAAAEIEEGCMADIADVLAPVLLIARHHGIDPAAPEDKWPHRHPSRQVGVRGGIQCPGCGRFRGGTPPPNRHVLTKHPVGRRTSLVSPSAGRWLTVRRL